MKDEKLTIETHNSEKELWNKIIKTAKEMYQLEAEFTPHIGDRTKLEITSSDPMAFYYVGKLYGQLRSSL